VRSREMDVGDGGRGKDRGERGKTYRLDNQAFWLIRSKNMRNGLRLSSEVLWRSDVVTGCDRHATIETVRAFVLSANKDLKGSFSNYGYSREEPHRN
jgi:hypothetical protein